MKSLCLRSMRVKWLLCCMITLTAPAHTFAQQDSLWLMEDAVDEMEFQMEDLENTEIVSEGMFEEMMEQMELSQSSKKPNLNNLSYETAVKQLLLTDYQYYQLQLYIETHGPLYSIFELDAIDGFSVAERL